ncbi:MAG: hypothetical protein HYY44_07820 [Deltaproteobacteria bacterium]|nr:hypothetical protein [Deltaproteobacteria bacterium]MBI4374729.1 hypothetical protein [Deltaproteobacteria bacterium]
MAAQIKICTETGCRNVQTTRGYCRLHYLKNWKNLKQEAEKKASERLNRYVEGIVKKYPDRYMEMIRKDLRGKKEFEPFLDDPTEEDVEGILEDIGAIDDESLEKMISQLRINKDF